MEFLYDINHASLKRTEKDINNFDEVYDSAMRNLKRNGRGFRMNIEAERDVYKKGRSVVPENESD